MRGSEAKRNVEDGEIAQLLADARAGDAAAWERFVALVYQDLRHLAHRQLGVRSREQTLDTTGLVHECYLRIARGERTPNDRGHFFALAARVMRQVIVDYARERLAHKRGAGTVAIPLDEIGDGELAQARELVDIDEALDTLERISDRRARVVECRFFAGLTEQETADALGVSLRLVQREWSEARRWLEEFLRA